MKVLVVTGPEGLKALLTVLAAMGKSDGQGVHDTEYVGECEGGDRRLLKPCCCPTCSARNSA